jgi:hypothetical protein
MNVRSGVGIGVAISLHQMPQASLEFVPLSNRRRRECRGLGAPVARVTRKTHEIMVRVLRAQGVHVGAATTAKQRNDAVGQ